MWKSSPAPFTIDDADEAEAASPVVIDDSMVTLQRVANGAFADAANRELKLTDQPVASLGGWQGKRYERKGSAGKVLDTAVIYTNQGAATQEPFATKHAALFNNEGHIPNAQLADLKPMAEDFRDTAGTKTHERPAGDTTSTHIIVRGTLDGAPGNFRCAVDAICTSAGGPDGTTLLSDGWFFVPGPGAMTSSLDDKYAGFGWWAQEDSMGADGFYVVVRSGPDADAKFVLSDTGGADVITAFKGLSGTATYNGHAAGKVAMYQSSDGNLAGTFTANVALIADFGAGADTGNSIVDGDASIKGTLNGFMVDGVAMDDWKVEFQDNRTMANRLGGFADGGGISYFGNTKWSIGDKEGDGTGRYHGVYIDQADSGLMRATVGRFTAQYGTVGSMTGGFGATTIDPDE